MSTAWFTLFAAGVFEICWAIGLKFSEGFTKLLPSILTVITYAASVWLLGRASRTLPIGTAYAVWTGIGATGTAVLGIVLFRESMNPARLFFLVLLVTAIVGLKFTAKN
jgi:Membrane transporters of cations and cationic drugs